MRDSSRATTPPPAVFVTMENNCDDYSTNTNVWRLSYAENLAFCEKYFVLSEDDENPFWWNIKTTQLEPLESFSMEEDDQKIDQEDDLNWITSPPIKQEFESFLKYLENDDVDISNIINSNNVSVERPRFDCDNNSMTNDDDQEFDLNYVVNPDEICNYVFNDGAVGFFHTLDEEEEKEKNESKEKEEIERKFIITFLTKYFNMNFEGKWKS